MLPILGRGGARDLGVLLGQARVALSARRRLILGVLGGRVKPPRKPGSIHPGFRCAPSRLLAGSIPGFRCAPSRLLAGSIPDSAALHPGYWRGPSPDSAALHPGYWLPAIVTLSAQGRSILGGMGGRVKPPVRGSCHSGACRNRADGCACRLSPGTPSFPRRRDKSASALNARRGGPKGERSESSRYFKAWIPAFAGMTGKGVGRRPDRLGGDVLDLVQFSPHGLAGLFEVEIRLQAHPELLGGPQCACQP